MEMIMKIAVLGAGNIGGTIGRKWAAAGHEVIFGVRDTGSTKVRTLLAEIDSGAKAASVPEAVVSAEVILLSIPHAAVAETVRANATALEGKIIIDATNKFGAPVINNIAVIQAAVSNAKIYRAFNSLGWEVFAQPKIGEIAADHFYCGPDGEGRVLIEGLIADVGVRPVYVGGLETAPTVDALGTLWVTLVFQRGMSRHSAFKLLTDSEIES
jgi:predicted dinucleotide-binding enzyme